jgi:regulator of sigma E protease
MLTTIFAFIIVLGVLVFVHELGHFLAAKWAGMYVHRFSVGMGPVIPWLSRKVGETEYALSWLPLGGYVKVATGEEDASSSALEGPAEREIVIPTDRLYESKPVWKRMIFVLGGVVFNIIFALTVFTGLAFKNGRQVDPATQIGHVTEAELPADAAALKTIPPGTRVLAVDGKPVHEWDEIQQGIINARGDSVTLALEGQPNMILPLHHDALGDRLHAVASLEAFRPAIIGQLLPNKPALKAGLQVGDTLLRIGSTPIVQWGDVLGLLDRSAGQPLEIEVGRAGGRLAIKVTPAADSVKAADGTFRRVGRVGMGVATQFRAEKYSFPEALGAGAEATVMAAGQIVRTVRGMFTGHISSREVGGPILIGQLAGQSIRLGFEPFLEFMALISVNLAVLNLLPVPVLDGGQLLFLVAEGVARRPLPLMVRERLTTVGLVLVMMLMVFSFSNDVRRWFGV